MRDKAAPAERLWVLSKGCSMAVFLINFEMEAFDF
jgi:hypothetical protein